MISKRLVWIWAGLIALAGLIPPWRRGGSHAYDPIFSGYGSLDLPVLLVEWVIITAVMGAIAYTQKRS